MSILISILEFNYGVFNNLLFWEGDLYGEGSKKCCRPVEKGGEGNGVLGLN